MDDSLKITAEAVSKFLKTRTGFLGFGPTYGEIILTAVIAYGTRRFQERSVVQEAENILAEINERNKML